MKKKRWAQGVMTAATLLLCVLLCLNVLDLYRLGMARRAAGGAAVPIFTWQDTAARMRLLLPFLALWLVGAIFFKASAHRKTVSVQPEKQHTSAASGKIRWIVFICAVAFIALGILNGGLHDVLVKAIQICTECIGLG